MSANLQDLPDCVKCGNTRKISSGYMSRDCVCTKKRATKGENIVNNFNPLTEKKKEIIAEPTQNETVASAEEKNSATLCATESEKPAPLSTVIEPIAESKSEPKKKGNRKTEVAYKLGRQMGYTDRVIEAILCERNYQNNFDVWERMYADIYIHPLATSLPPNYDPTKWIPGDKARDAFRDSLINYLPNKKRKVNFDDLCDTDLKVENEQA